MQIAHRHISNRTVFIAAAIPAAMLLVYFAVIPMVVARLYLNRMNSAILQARADIKAVSTGSDVVIFQDPDTTLTKRQTLVSKTLKDLKTAQRSLDNMQAINRLPVLPGGGLVPPYHAAAVRQTRATYAIQQSRQVLDEYTKSLRYIDAYTTPLLHLENQLRYVNSIRDFTTLTGGGTMAAAASELRADRKRLSSLTPPPDFLPLHDGALRLLDQTADSFERLSNGLNQHSDVLVYGAVDSLEQLEDTYESYSLNALTELAQNSATLRQLVELPEKIEHVGGI